MCAILASVEGMPLRQGRQEVGYCVPASCWGRPSPRSLCDGAQCVPFWLAWKECLCGKEGKRLATACPRRAGAVQARAAKSMRESATPQQPGEVDARGVACALWGVCAL